VDYPICTLTYDVALQNYGTAGFAKATEVGRATYDYLDYVVNSKEGGGQSAVTVEHDYDQLPTFVITRAQEEAALVAGGP
jgi:hypothetical protein